LWTPTSGLELTAAEMVQLLPVTAVKLSDVAQASTTTLVNDAALFLPVAANATYEITMFVIYTQGTVGQLKFGWSAPSGATFDWTTIGLVISVTSADNGSYTAQALVVTDTKIVGGAATNTVMRVTGRLVTSSTSGTLNFKWAQSVSSATGTAVKAGSYIIGRQIA
jgi:hypothetical protein